MDDYRTIVSRCTDCGNCADVCSICRVVDDSVYSPRSKIELVGKLEDGLFLEEEELDSLYLCTMCGLCDDVCPEDIPLSDVIKYERGLVAVRGEEPEKTPHIIDNILEAKNPGGFDNSKRMDWVSDDLEFSDDGEIGYMAGCWISFKYPEIAQQTVKVLNKAGIKPQLIEDEKCCGLFVTDNGHTAELELYAKDYTMEIENQGIQTLVVSCPACYGQMNDMYPRLYREPEFEVKLSMEVYKDLIEEGKLELEETEGELSIKDGCPVSHLFNIPREIVDEMGYSVKELFEDETICCGAPAGVKPNYPEISEKIGKLAIDKAKETRDGMVTYCPFCQYHYEGIEESKDIQMQDLTTLLHKKLK
ncbi:Fe-S oxidoreductase subunit, GlpC family [Methanonatronarchaeum thermophilum]|uniref:Fe-S oxidoreductase subunit, GlpC family n=1 Tax=Methanonatronarchaeum thermophilum TaxID=1927129 RepID=A0A1Y3GA32_9EURY|nr:(Fe-S)-binding protein [Methanonatronarchaeum thermophilum]OUJ18110.1 Fe-S oxidoreductase subunit, GlpC family [Methanonatronarchaeum thermophilum]